MPEQSHVLVVDDNEANRDVLSRRLMRQGIRTTSAENGRRALEQVRSTPFDLILLDVMMPEMNGYQVLEVLKTDPALRHIPVIMISAVDDIDSVVRCIELGAEDYLFKPFNPVLLKARVEASLEKKFLRDKERAYLKAVKQELELGRRTQADFFPVELPQVPGWWLGALFQPAREVGGDFYDVFWLPDQRLALVMADVCDKGVRAALFMVLVRSLLRAFAEQAANAGDDPLLSVQLTNTYITRHHHNRSHLHMFATLFCGILEPATGQLTYINAGHEAPLVLGPHGIEAILDTTGPAVGFMPDSRYGQATITLGPGTTLLTYTDGVTEARNLAGELFTEERLHELINQPYSTASALLEHVHAGVTDFVGTQTPADDITILALARLEPTD